MGGCVCVCVYVCLGVWFWLPDFWQEPEAVQPERFLDKVCVGMLHTFDLGGVNTWGTD